MSLHFFQVPEGSLDKPLPYQFYAGIELHPRMFGNPCSQNTYRRQHQNPGVDIKQWTNCRVGMLGWALLSLNFAIVSNQVGELFRKEMDGVLIDLLVRLLWSNLFQVNGPKLAPMVNALLINIYLFKWVATVASVETVAAQQKNKS